jgi:hypothetical protein
LQTPPVQSLFDPQLLPTGQVRFCPQPAPQSTSVSMPLRTPSAQVGSWHVPFWQLVLPQSSPTRHSFPTAHRRPSAVHMLPPQSTPTSDPFRIPSVQVACGQFGQLDALAAGVELEALAAGGARRS